MYSVPICLHAGREGGLSHLTMLFNVTSIITILDGLFQTIALCTPSSGHRIVISSQIDADDLSICDTIRGSLYINASGPIILDGVKNLTGSVSATGEVSAITSESILSIGGIIEFGELANLESVRFPNLLSVGSLSFSLPNLKTLDFGAGLQILSGVLLEGRPKRLFVVKGTKLQQLNGLNFPSVDELIIEDNANLGYITFGLETLGDLTNISGNGYNNDNETAFSCPFLTTVNGEARLENLRDISIPRLNTVNGTFNITNNTINAFDVDNLVSVTGTLALQGNEFLQNISATRLKTITELVIIGNPNVQIIDGFTSVTNANTITLDGNQTSVMLPNLTSVDNLSLQSSDEDFNCQPLNNRRCLGIIEGEYQCQGATVSIAKSPTSCSNFLHGLTLREKLAIAFGVMTGVLILAALVYPFCRRSGCFLGCFKRPEEIVKTMERERNDSIASEIWFDTTLNADTRYMYVNRNRVMERATPAEEPDDAGHWEVREPGEIINV